LLYSSSEYIQRWTTGGNSDQDQDQDQDIEERKAQVSKLLCDVVLLADALIVDKAAPDEIRALVLLVRSCITSHILEYAPQVTLTAVLTLLRSAEPVWMSVSRVLHEAGAWAMLLDLVKTAEDTEVKAVAIRGLAHWLHKEYPNRQPMEANDESARSTSCGVFVWIDEALEASKLTKEIYLSLLEAMTGSVTLSGPQSSTVKVDLQEGAMRRFLFPEATTSLLKALPSAEFELQV